MIDYRRSIYIRLLFLVEIIICQNETDTGSKKFSEYTLLTSNRMDTLATFMLPK